MLNAKVIGVGAAGNKAAIALIEKHILPEKNILLLNSTLRDVPEKYKEYAIEFGDTKGCGKERNLAKNMILSALNNEQVKLDSFLDPSDKMIIIVTSSEGGTGCGASTVIADYMSSLLSIPVHMFVFTGFEDDVRGLKNTVDWFSDLKPEYVVQAISNKKFLESCGNNRFKAEAAANEEFANRIGILLGTEVYPSDNNMDDTDMLKLTTTPGYMTIETCHLTKLKDTEQFNALMQTMIDDSKSLDTEQSARRIGIVFNGSPKTQAAIDTSFDLIRQQYGYPIEFFQHYQNVQDEEFINVIVSGMKLPIDDIKGAYERYKKQLDRVDRTKEQFFDKKLETSDIDEYDMGSGLGSVDPKAMQKGKNDFFSKYGMGKQTAQPSNDGKKKEKFTNTTKNSDEL
jgi:hypothetical protein